MKPHRPNYRLLIHIAILLALLAVEIRSFYFEDFLTLQPGENTLVAISSGGTLSLGFAPFATTGSLLQTSRINPSQAKPFTLSLEILNGIKAGWIRIGYIYLILSYLIILGLVSISQRLKRPITRRRHLA